MNNNIPKVRELRKQQTPTEQVLWLNIRNRRLGRFRFIRQYSAGPYILDFYCPVAHLAVELDGPIHNSKPEKEYDKNRDLYLRELGIQVLRFKNDEVNGDLASVLTCIHLSCSQERSR